MLQKYIKNIGLGLGVIGLIVFMFGLLETNVYQKNLIVLFATFFLFLSAIIQKEPFFRGLQGIVFISAIVVFSDFPQKYNLILILILGLFFSIYYIINFKLNIARVSAFIGLVALCFGIILGRNEPMIIGGVTLAIYSIFSIREGYTVGWVFLVLNILFAMVAANI